MFNWLPAYRVFTVDESIRILRKSDERWKEYNIGTNGWRMLYCTQFRANSENYNQTSHEIPYDVQQNIADLVWKNYKADSEGKGDII